jgi:hypothetical protein
MVQLSTICLWELDPQKIMESAPEGQSLRLPLGFGIPCIDNLLVYESSSPG